MIAGTPNGECFFQVVPNENKTIEYIDTEISLCPGDQDSTMIAMKEYMFGSNYNMWYGSNNLYHARCVNVSHIAHICIYRAFRWTYPRCLLMVCHYDYCWVVTGFGFFFVNHRIVCRSNDTYNPNIRVSIL